MSLSRRDFVRSSLTTAAVLALPLPLQACARGTPEAGAPGEVPGEDAAAERASLHEPPTSADEARLLTWTRALREGGLHTAQAPLGRAAARVGELAIGTPYEAFTLEEYLRAGGSPMRTEPLTLSLTRFDCVSLVEACLAIARMARSDGVPTWEGFGQEMERLRYRGGERAGYTSRLHYFSEWISDNARRGIVRELGQELGGRPDTRPLRFMSSNPDSYPALAHAEVREEIAQMERSLDDQPRYVIPTERIPEVDPQIQTGDILAFATAIEGLDVTHSAYAYRDEGGVLRVLHAPLSGGVVEITRSTLPEYVRAIRRSTGILVARPV
ncbi:DUF1460 domain-containing protein [soil metagenome]